MKCRPQKIDFEPASSLYIGQGGAKYRAPWEGVIQELKISRQAGRAAEYCQEEAGHRWGRGEANLQHITFYLKLGFSCYCFSCIISMVQQKSSESRLSIMHLAVRYGYHLPHVRGSIQNRMLN